MATAQIMIGRDKTVKSGIRPVQGQRDMPAIVELIDIGFGEELDPKGLKMLEQMRRVAQYQRWAQWLSPSQPTPEGLVWVEEGRVVGNLSLRPAYPRSTGGWLIGNVVVHPEFRSHGIGRALMDAATEKVRSHSGKWIGLEVREDNEVARRLYEDMGYQAVGRLQHMIHPAGKLWPTSLTSQQVWRASRPEDKRHWFALAKAIYRRRQREILGIRPNIYEFGGMMRAIEMWFSGERERSWLQMAGDEARLAARVWTDRRGRFHEWDLFIHPLAGAAGARETVAYVTYEMRRTRPWATVAIIADQASLHQALLTVGFNTHRTLLQMQCDLL
ncbi:MAG: GNAT family N-acetyltransferase [Anaerolineales bacterium]